MEQVSVNKTEIFRLDEVKPHLNAADTADRRVTFIKVEEEEDCTELTHEFKAEPDGPAVGMELDTVQWTKQGYEYCSEMDIKQELTGENEETIRRKHGCKKEPVVRIERLSMDMLSYYRDLHSVRSKHPQKQINGVGHPEVNGDVTNSSKSSWLRSEEDSPGDETNSAPKQEIRQSSSVPKVKTTASKGVESGRVMKLRRAFTVAQKLNIIKKLEEGKRIRDLCALYGISSSTVRSIFLQKERLSQTAKSSVLGAHLQCINRSRDNILEKVESLIVHWMDSQGHNHAMLPFNVVQEKALALYWALKKKAEEEGTPINPDFEFKFSHGWFHRFKKRAKFHYEKAGANELATLDFPDELKKIIKAGGYSAKQIFSIDEMGLFWKKMPLSTYVSLDEEKVPGYKTSKEQLYLVLGGNVEGDFKLKPALVYHSETPQALKHIMKTELPVTWYSNKKSLVNGRIYTNYFSSYLSPAIAKYCAKENLDNKALVILDNAPGHPKTLEVLEPNIRVIFLPASATSILHPMGQGVKDVFKAYYLQLLMRYIIAGLDTSKDMTVKQLWRNYDIKIAADNIALAWEKVPPQCMNSCWKNLLPDIVHGCKGFEELLADITTTTVQLANEAGFHEVGKGDVESVLASRCSELTNEELIQLLEEKTEDLGDYEVELPKPKVLDARALRKAFRLARQLAWYIEDNDPDVQRRHAFRRGLEKLLACYAEIYWVKMAADKRNTLDIVHHPISTGPLLSTSAPAEDEQLSDDSPKPSSRSSFS